MSTNLEYRTRERQRKRESRRQGSEAQREKGEQSCRVRDKKQRRRFFPRRTTWEFCRGGDKIRNASGHQCKVKMSGVKNSVTVQYCSVSFIESYFEISSTDLKVRTTQYSVMNGTTGKCCAETFFWIVTLLDFIPWLKSWNHPACTDHKKHHRNIMASSFHLNSLS